MAVIRQGILGGFRGSVAGVVGSSWKGIAVMKSKPLSVANPNTPAQQEQRGRMTAIVEAARLLLAALIQPFWNPFAQRMSGYNAFVRENIAAFAGNALSVPASFFSTRGSLLGVVVSSVVADDGDSEITVSWANNAGQADALGTDEVVVVVYNSDQDYWLTSIGDAIRSAGTLVIADAAMDTGDELYIYTSVARPNISKVSDSVYTNSVVIA